MVKLTKAQRRTLQWFADQPGPAHLFAHDGPSLNMRRWAERAGYVSTATRPDLWVAFTITPAGRALLTQGGTNGK